MIPLNEGMLMIPLNEGMLMISLNEGMLMIPLNEGMFLTVIVRRIIRASGYKSKYRLITSRGIERKQMSGMRWIQIYSNRILMLFHGVIHTLYVPVNKV
jgi:hypothetical protein